MIRDVIYHYDHLIDEGQDPVKDPPKLQAYMSKWDGEPFMFLKCGFCEIEKYETDHAYLIKAKRE